jgi:hypothetical protein
MIVTKHTQSMLVEAEHLASQAELLNRPYTDVLFDLERAANLAEHAAAELRDEWLRARERHDLK